MSETEKGRLIVIDGNDGSGKTMQLNLLKNNLEQAGLQVVTFDFPQYSTFHGSMVGRFLSGELGDLSTASPYLVTYPYALDRMSTAPQIKQALNEGKMVLCNRYVTSNMGHQAGRFKDEKERKEYVDWDMELEYGHLGIPKEDAVVYLFVPRKTAQELMNNENRSNGREYRGEKQKDMVESDDAYLSGAEKAYLELASRFKHWIKVICVDDRGKMLPPGKINKTIRDELHKKGFI